MIESNLGAYNSTDIHHCRVNYAADIHHIFNIGAIGEAVSTPSLDLAYFPDAVASHSYILKVGVEGVQTPQTILIFRRKIVWERKNY